MMLERLQPLGFFVGLPFGLSLVLFRFVHWGRAQCGGLADGPRGSLHDLFRFSPVFVLLQELRLVRRLAGGGEVLPALIS